MSRSIITDWAHAYPKVSGGLNRGMADEDIADWAEVPLEYVQAIRANREATQRPALAPITLHALGENL